MAAYFAILEDDPDRIIKMRSCVAEVLPSLPPVFFENAFEMIDWLKQHLHEVCLMSLDHDLPLRGSGGISIDCGDGRMVADYLSRLPPTCPVIVHSSNNECAAGMFFALERASWPTKRIIPVDDLDWIGRDWKAELRRLTRTGWLATGGRDA